jgi:Xaa-Pro aminopeptidase
MVIKMIKELHFPLSEFRARLTAVKKEMTKRGIDILVLSEPPNQNYLTGYNAYSFYTPQTVIVAQDHAEPIWVGRFMDRVSATMTTYLAEDNIRAYPDTYVQSMTLSPYDFMADIVKELRGENARIGVEMGGYYYPARGHADLTRALPNAEFVDADLLVGWIRLVKSSAEVAIMRQAGQLADVAMKRVIDTVEAGVRECDIAAAIYYQQVSGTAEFGGDYPCCPPDLCIGERSIAPHAAWTDDRLPDSTVVNVELSGCRHRYQVNLARTIVVGKPSPPFQDLSEIAIEALNVGLEAVRPGRTCSEVDSDFRQALACHGIEKESRIGYPTGIGFPPASGERTASIRKGDETVLKPGMVFHMMPGLWLGNVGITITQSFAVSETGFEPLTATPRKLFIK